MSSNRDVPARSRVARYYAADDIRIEWVPTPVPGPGEALVETAACGICTGEIVPWYIGRKAPLVPGHEPAGPWVAINSSRAARTSRGVRWNGLTTRTSS